ncbi:DUF4194 domain-containing protein [Inhella sp.]|uniref:DUF4194 domain-containing protein n=1 Tax=Inhella sp. TaxID=1921806 RepID=UPI0035AFFA7A
MSFWTDAAEATRNVATEDDFEAAACRLVNEQVLYAADRGSKVVYGLIRDFERDFRRALDPLGYVVRVNSQLRYACAIPKHAKVSSVSVEQTLLALVLRKIFDEETRSGHHDENGEVACDLVTLEVKYKQTTGGRELATGGKLRELMRWMRRWGIARVSDEEDEPFGHDVDQPYAVVIRPGITEVLGEAALARIALFTNPHAGVDAVDDDAAAAAQEGGAV